MPDCKFQSLKFVRKFIHHQDQLPYVCSYYFNKNRIFHSYNTRTKDALHSQSFFISSLGQRSITYKGAILWNALPEQLKSKRHCFCDKIFWKITVGFDPVIRQTNRQTTIT